jgi:hypothetical protein
MTKDELYESVWKDLPATKRIAGRRRVSRIVDRALKRWPVAVLQQCDEKQAEIVGKHFSKAILREERQEVGMGFILAIVLGTLISEIIRILLHRWFDRPAEMTELCR